MSAGIRLDGRTRRTFLFPAPVEETFRYYARAEHIFSFLPHITFLDALDDGVYRLLYHSTELNIYRVRLYCDLRAALDAEGYTLRFSPLEGSLPAAPKAGLDWLEASGFYTSTSIFRPHHDGQTAVEYTLHLWADLPRPWGLRMLPQGTMNRIANAIAKFRIQEIADGFIQRTIEDYLHRR